MARGDIKIRTQVDPAFAFKAVVSSGGASTIKAGEPTKQTSVGAVVIMADGDGTTSQKFAGVAKTDSTDTASAAGEVYTWLPLPGYVYEAKAKSSAAVDTQAEIDALFGKRVVFDLTSSTWTIDTAAANAATNGVSIVGGDVVARTVYFVIAPQITLFDNPTTA